jgi:hypothetical protein
MATVYRAYDSKLNLEVALKFLTSQLAAVDASFIARFRREGQTLAKLTHPNILRLYEIGEDSRTATYYLVLEYLSGGSLRDRYSQRCWSSNEVAALLRPVASALDFAHRQSPPVVHRDLKPSNIMFAGDDRPVVCDFGLVKLLDPDSRDDGLQLSLTMNQVVGTPVYMSPEQAAGLPVGPASDRFSLAVVAYELLTATVPFAADSARSTMRLVMDSPLPPPSTRNPALARRIDALFERALAKRPEDRFPTSEAFVDALCAQESAEPTLARTIVTRASTPAASKTGSHRWWMGAAAAVALACVTLPALGIRAGAFQSGDTPTTEVTPSISPQVMAVPVHATPVSTTRAAPTPAASVTVMPTSTQAPPTPTSTAQPTPTPTLDRAWQSALENLDLTWAQDWPASIATANTFVATHPDFQPAREKLYAARVSYAEQLLSDGQISLAIEQLESADSLSPERPEAREELLALTPVPTPSRSTEQLSIPMSTRPSQPTPRLPGSQTITQQHAAQTGPTVPQDPPATAPTPTRIPFVPR